MLALAAILLASVNVFGGFAVKVLGAVAAGSATTKLFGDLDAIAAEFDERDYSQIELPTPGS